MSFTTLLPDMGSSSGKEAVEDDRTPCGIELYTESTMYWCSIVSEKERCSPNDSVCISSADMLDLAEKEESLRDGRPVSVSVSEVSSVSISSLGCP